jgi:hypothetical protein
MTEKTYQRLQELASLILQAGQPVIVDATFLKKIHRDQFIELAKLIDVPYVILDLQASEDTLRSRIMKREELAQDVSEATFGVLQHQMKTDEAITASEARYTIQINMEKKLDMEGLVQQINLYKGGLTPT